MANFTFHTTTDSTPLSCVFDENFVTAHGGYSFIASVLRRCDFFRPLIDVLDKELPRTYPFYLYTNEDIIEQLMAGLIIGLPRFSDADQMKRDPLCKAVVSSKGLASSSTVSRFVQAIDQAAHLERKTVLEKDRLSEDKLKKTDPRLITTPLMEKLNYSLLEQALKVVDDGSLDPVIIDVDGTPIKLYGHQEHVAFDGHYGCNCYLPIFVTINGVPAFIQNAPGAANGAALFLNHVDAILTKVQQAFPNRKIIVRADTGYNNDELLERIAHHHCGFVVGANVAGGKYQTKALKAQVFEDMANKTAADGIPADVLRFFALDNFTLSDDLPTKNGLPKNIKTFRCSGLLRDYRAKSWKAPRTFLCYRLQYNSDHRNDPDGGVNIRYIQSNLTREELLAITDGRGERKARSNVSVSLEPSEDDVKIAVELYEGFFCDRAQDEGLNCEWKSYCYASQCSCEGFFGNSFRMLLSGFAMLALIACVRWKIFPEKSQPTTHHRASRKPNVTRSHQAEKQHIGPTIRSIRKYLINVPALLKVTKRRVTIRFARDMHPDWKEAMIRLSNLN